MPIGKLLITSDRAFIHEQTTCRSNTGNHFQMSTPTSMLFADAIRQNIFINWQKTMKPIRQCGVQTSVQCQSDSRRFHNENSFIFISIMHSLTAPLWVCFFFFSFLLSYLNNPWSTVFQNVNTVERSPWCLTFEKITMIFLNFMIYWQIIPISQLPKTILLSNMVNCYTFIYCKSG
jgi:hypothetical protein